MDPLRPDQLLKTLFDDLTLWGQSNKALVSIAQDPYHFLELLAEKPTGVRVVVHWDGDSNLTEHPLGGAICSERFKIGLTGNLGLTAKPSEALVKDSSTRVALLHLLSDLRDRVRGLVFPADATEQYVLYKGAQPLVMPDGIPLSGWELNFELTSALPAVVYRTE